MQLSGSSDISGSQEFRIIQADPLFNPVAWLLLVEHDQPAYHLLWFVVLAVGAGILWYIMARKRYPKDDA